jgi:cysteine desulfurase
MMVNNEVGTVQPIREIVKIIRHARKTVNPIPSTLYPLLHTDAAQALYEDINMESLGVDLLTLDGSKVYGPRGIGCLYIRRGTPIETIIYGGGQERGMRSGTENVPAVMGFAKALELLGAEHIKIGHFSQLKWSESKMVTPTDKSMRIYGLRALLIEKLKAIQSDITVNGATTSPHILNVSIPGIDNEFFVLQLDAKGIACSTKSSCLRDEDESYVLKAMKADSKTSVRFSFGRYTRKRDIIKAAKIIAGILHRG